MFKKLRIKFIAITMVMVAVVMAFAFTVVCVSEYQQTVTVVQTALFDAANNAVEISEMNSRENPFMFNGESEEGQSSSAGPFQERGNGPRFNAPISIDDEGFGQGAPPAIGNRGGRERASSSLIPVAVYATATDGVLRIVPQVTSATIDESTLTEAAESVVNGPDGYSANESLSLHVYKRTVNESVYLSFTDMSYTDSWKSLAFMLCIIGLATMVLFFIACLFYSKWALRPVREAWDSQKQFVADASHDLKTPLTVILANSSILLKHPDHTIAAESQWVESTQKEAEQMQGLVNEMLELASVEAGEVSDAAKELVDFSDLVDGETLLFDAVALERNCTFECSVEQSITVMGDKTKLSKMVSTIIENAFKYVDDGGSIDVRLSKDKKMARLEVGNTGSAIAPEDLPHIFDRFYRSDKARTSGEGGFGLGLAIARQIAQSHGGDITCASEDSKGTTFTITLPIA